MSDRYKKIHQIEKLRSAIFELDKATFAERDLFHKEAALIIKKIFGEQSQYLDDWRKIEIPCEPTYKDDTNAFFDYLHECRAANQKMVNLCIVMIKDLQNSEDLKVAKPQANKENKSRSNRIFVVHGRDEEMKQSVARIIEKLGLEPVILHEQPNRGRTIIEKFTDYSDVGFAVVLLSPDDLGKIKEETVLDGHPRARQNVVFELGFFIGKLGRENVMPIYRESLGFEMPSDYAGVVYTAFDFNGRWKFQLVKELNACKYEVDANRIL